MTDETPDPDGAQSLAAYFDAVSIRDDRSVCTRLDLRDDLCDSGGALRIGAVTYAVDVATGLASGVAVLDRDLWVVTTDLDVQVTAPVTVGPLRVDVEVLRAGATTVVAGFTLHDEGNDRPVGGGTSTSRPFPFEFDRSFLDVPIGKQIRFHGAADGAIHREPMLTRLGFRVAEDGTVDVDVDDWLRNPWGILHGGVTACLVDLAAELAARRPSAAPHACTPRRFATSHPDASDRCARCRGFSRSTAVVHWWRCASSTSAPTAAWWRSLRWESPRPDGSAAQRDRDLPGPEVGVVEVVAADDLGEGVLGARARGGVDPDGPTVRRSSSARTVTRGLTARASARAPPARRRRAGRAGSGCHGHRARRRVATSTTTAPSSTRSTVKST